MKPETILQSNLLDILFENRNKDYGAYSLRKNYNKRLLQAMGGTGLIVALFIMLQSMKPKDHSITIYNPLDSVTLITVIVPPEEKKPIEQRTQSKPQPTVNDQAPVIKPDNEVPDTKIPTIDDLDKGNLGTKTVDIPATGDPGPPVTEPVGGGTAPAPVVTEPAPTVPLNFAEIMPSFNGDLKKYMLRNLPQPEDIEAGEKIMVRVKFVVTAEGEVTNVEIIQSGRPDLDKEVLRVVKKMPRWKPGIQGGRAVPVYFHLPITFISNDE